MKSVKSDSKYNIKNKKESNKQTMQPVVFRKGQKPAWVEEDSDASDEDIFNISNHEIEVDKSEIKIERNIVNNKGGLKELDYLDRGIKKTNDLNDANRSNKNNNEEVVIDRLKLRREIYKSEVIIEENANKVQKDNKATEIIDLSRRRELPVTNTSKAIVEEEEDELLELIGGDHVELEKEDNDQKANPDNNDSMNSDTDEEDDDESAEVLMRPIFVSKEDRVTLNEELQRQFQANEALVQQSKLKEIKKKQTKEIVKKYIEEEENKETAESKEDTEADEQMPDDTDNLDDLEEYEKWKLRELKRIKIQFDEDEKKLKKRLEIDRRRNLTNEQRKEENLRLGSDDTLKPFKSKINFLQKYYHKGVFFQHDAKEDMEHIYNRDYNLPTWEDKVDRSVMPKLLQVRRGLQFKKGRSKYTHLTSEDTTNFDPTYKVPENISNKFMDSFGGYKAQNDFDLSKKKRKNV